MILRPRAVNEALRWTILQELLCTCLSTSEIATETNIPISTLRTELMRLHHVGLIKPIGFKNPERIQMLSIYQRDTIWDMSDHGRYHDDIVYECRHCRLREKMLLLSAPNEVRREFGLE